MLGLDFENAHTFCYRDKFEEELKIHVVYHYMLMSYSGMYGKTVTIQWHFENGPDILSTSFQLSCEGLRQGDDPTSVYFNVLIARVYKKQIISLTGRGVIFAVADDVNMLGPPAVIAKLTKVFPALAWNEAGLKTQSVKNKVYVQPFAQNVLSHFISSTPRSTSFDLPVHNILDGSDPCDPSNPLSWRI